MYLPLIRRRWGGAGTYVEVLMHILFLTDNFPPETNAPASRTHEHAREWVKAGHRVTVITCVPNFPKGKVFKGYRNKLWQKEEIDGIEVIRVWSYITGNEGFLLRILDYQSYMVTSFLAALFIRRPDVVIGTSPQFFTAVAAWAVSAVKRRPFVFELRDIWPESIRAVGAMKSSRILDFFEKIELFLYRRARTIISVTHSFKTNLIERGIDGDKIQVVTNGVDLSKFSPRPKDPELLNELSLEGCFVTGYIGTHGMAHGLETLLNAARILQDDPESSDIRMLLLGHGATKANLIAQSERMGLKNVQFIDSVSKEEVSRYWSLLDVSIIHLRKSPLFQTVIPSKIFECMGMGIPILLGVGGEAAEIVESAKAGQIFEPEDAKALALRIRGLKATPQLTEELRRNGMSAAERYNRKILAHKMQRHLKV